MTTALFMFFLRLSSCFWDRLHMNKGWIQMNLLMHLLNLLTIWFPYKLCVDVYYSPPTKFREGNVFTDVFLSIHRLGVLRRPLPMAHVDLKVQGPSGPPFRYGTLRLHGPDSVLPPGEHLVVITGDLFKLVHWTSLYRKITVPTTIHIWSPPKYLRLESKLYASNWNAWLL